MIWNESRECMSRDELMTMQSARLKKTGQPRLPQCGVLPQKMQQVGLEPGDIRGIEDISRLPYTTRDDLRDTYPFGLFAVPMSEIVRIHASSGTTGKPRWWDIQGRILTHGANALPGVYPWPDLDGAI